MKRLLLALLLTATAAQAQSILRNSFTTNSAGRTPNVLPTNTNSIYPLMVLNPDGTGTDRQILYSPFIFLQGSNLFVNGAVVGNGGGGATTNYYSTIITTNLTVLNSLTVSNITVTNVTVQNNLTVSNLFTVNGNHNTLIVSNALTLQTVKTNVLATTSSGLITNVNYGSGLTWTPSTLTLSASSSGAASVWVPNTALTYSGSTNLTLDGSGGTNFYVLLTNTAFFTTPANIPASGSTNTSFTVFFQQDSTGARAVTWTNANFKFPGGSQFQPLTNASSVSWVSFTMSPFTNGIFMGDYGVIGNQ